MKTRSCLSKALTYLSGLFITERNKRNIERMVESNGANYQSQQHFITDSPWSAAEAMKVVAKKTNIQLGSVEDQVLSFDESSFAKAGEKSVGVSRQYNGNLGKVENSQTGVYASLSKGTEVCLINAKLYLPHEWIDAPKRCKEAGIPDSAIVYKTKPELAIEMLDEIIANGIEFGWITADGLYGQSYNFCKAIDERELDFIVDVHKDQHVYLEKPELRIPERKSKRGRPSTKKVADQEAVEVQAYKQTLTKDDYTQIKVRKGTKGWIKVMAHKRQVWVWDHEEDQSRARTLIITKGSDVKYRLSNVTHQQVGLKELVNKGSQRHFIEKAFGDGKGELGLADYQIRKYTAWYHHQALVMMAMNYILTIKMKYKSSLPLLSVRDVRMQIIEELKNQGVFIEKEIKQMLLRHKQRYSDIQRFYRNDEFLE